MKPDFSITNGELNAPRNIAIGIDGSIYVVDSGNSRIVKYNARREMLSSWGNRIPEGQLPPAEGTFNEPWGIALDDSGNVLIADTWNHRIQKFDRKVSSCLSGGNPAWQAMG